MEISALEERYKEFINCNEILKHDIDVNKCEEQLEGFTDEKMTTFLNKYASKNIAVLKIYLKEPYYTNIIRDRQITFISFVGNTGGLVGLCLGLSFISIFEGIYHFFNFVASGFTLLLKSRKSGEPQSQEEQ